MNSHNTTGKAVSVRGREFTDSLGNPVKLCGVNMVCKDRTLNHIGGYTDEDFEFLGSLGMNLIRLGIFWESVEPAPGKYDDDYLDKVAMIVAKAKAHGIYVYLDMHQDLFGAEIEDGAPAWATITDGKEHIRTELWSESYLISGAVQAAFDNFWANTPASDGTGIMDHFISAWCHVAERFANEPFVIGYDFFNEPFPGSAALNIVPVLGGVMAKLEAGTVTEADLFETISAIEPVTGTFEEEKLNPFYNKIVKAVRKADPSALIMLETNYFSNAGIPTHVVPVTDDNGEPLYGQVYAPHGYDIFVDTDHYDDPDTSRVDLIFGTHAQVAEALGLPILIGEWGCFPDANDVQVGQAKHIKALFASIGAADTYFDFSHLRGNRVVEALKVE